MKLNLASRSNIYTLSVGGELKDHDSQVLRAGIQKLLKDGRHRIIVDVKEVSVVSPQSIRDLCELNSIAQELQGEIVLSGVTPALRNRVEAYSRPPVLLMFNSNEAAFRHQQGKIEEWEKPPASSSSRSSASSLSSEPATRPASPEPPSHKDVLEATHLRKQLEEARESNRMLKENLRRIVFERKNPVELKAYQQKIDYLEKRLADKMGIKDQESN